MSQGLLFIVCGPSGVGKTSLCHGLLERRSDLIVSVSYTTRAPRGGEEDGVDYHFVDQQTFLQMRDRELFAESAEVHGNYYGTAVDVIRQAWDAGNSVLFDIDYQGARQLKARFPGATAVLIIPPSLAVLEQRLRGRGTDREAVIERRLAAARHELAQYELFDFVVENNRFPDALDDLTVIYDAAGHRTSLHADRLRRMLSDS